MRAVIWHATSVAAIGVLPTFLVGALVVQLRGDLGIGVQEIGIATAALFITAALMAPAGARSVHVRGSAWALVAAPLISAAALVLLTVSQGLPMLVGAMIVGGVGNSVAQPVANLRLAEAVTHGRLGLAFGVKQAAVPLASLFAGLMVPTVAVAHGWRWVGMSAAVAALALALWGARVGRRRPRPVTDRPRPSSGPQEALSRRTMLLITIAAFFAASIGTSVGVFFVQTAISSGFDASVAGALYACLSVVGFATRILLGWWSDHRPKPSSYRLAAGLVAVGVVGAVLILVGGGWGFLVGATLAYVFGWAWPGLLHFSVTRDNPAAIAAATGFLQSGSSLGAGVGPLFFGFLFGVSFEGGWMTIAVLGTLAAVLLTIASVSASKGR